MSKTPASKDKSATEARHGAPSEVTWKDGAGRQPYTNQETPEDEEPAAAGEFSEGDRGELSGRNLEQLERVKKKP